MMGMVRGRWVSGGRVEGSLGGLLSPVGRDNEPLGNQTGVSYPVSSPGQTSTVTDCAWTQCACSAFNIAILVKMQARLGT